MDNHFFFFNPRTINFVPTLDARAFPCQHQLARSFPSLILSIRVSLAPSGEPSVTSGYYIKEPDLLCPFYFFRVFEDRPTLAGV